MIVTEGLTKHYGGVAAIEDVSFDAKPGQIVGFLGPNGAGKTTTMRILTGFMPASSGTAMVAGKDVHENPLSVRKRVGYLPETVPLYDEMLVQSYLTYVATIKGIDSRDRKVEVQRVLDRCGLSDMSKRLVRNLSRGYRQRVGLAQALVGNPPVLILDEPTVGLDPEQIIVIRKLIRDLAIDRTVLLSTHILPEVSAVCNRVVIISRGRIVAKTSLAQLDRETSLTFTLQADGYPEKILPLLREAPDVESARHIEGDLYEFICTTGDRASDILRALLDAGHTIGRLDRRKRSLEDMFVDVISTDASAHDDPEVA